jgi:hypothetical protein
MVLTNWFLIYYFSNSGNFIFLDLYFNSNFKKRIKIISTNDYFAQNAKTIMSTNVMKLHIMHTIFFKNMLMLPLR